LIHRIAAPGQAWGGLAVLLGLLALAGWGLPRTVLDWQPALALTQPWRALTAIGVHYSGLHLLANLAGAAAVGALGIAARAPLGAAWAWAAAWPLTQLGLLLEPALIHYGGLSGVLHAGVAVIAVVLLWRANTPGPTPGLTSTRRWVGLALLAGLAGKVLLEAPWGAPLRYPAGIDIAVAPLAHASGLVCGLLCAVVARLATGIPRSQERNPPE
jgi:rhomboid family GlyGly-CTERM serine protease